MIFFELGPPNASNQLYLLTRCRIKGLKQMWRGFSLRNGVRKTQDGSILVIGGVEEVVKATLQFVESTQHGTKINSYKAPFPKEDHPPLDCPKVGESV